MERNANISVAIKSGSTVIGRKREGGEERGRGNIERIEERHGSVSDETGRLESMGLWTGERRTARWVTGREETGREGNMESRGKERGYRERREAGREETGREGRWREGDKGVREAILLFITLHMHSHIFHRLHEDIFNPPEHFTNGRQRMVCSSLNNIGEW